MPIILNGTSGITGPDGSASVPAVRGTDADTGFVFAAGQITATLNGVSGANVPLVSGTAQNSTSGTSIDFTGIPSWVKRVTVMFNGVSTSGTSNLLIQIGAGSVDSASYNSTTFYSASTSVNTTSSTAGFVISTNAATDTKSGLIQIALFGSNAWIASGWCKSGTTTSASTMGDKTLSGTLDRIRITTVNGTDTFDAGSINIMYE